MSNRRFWMIFLLAASSLSALLLAVRFLIPSTASVLSMPVTLVLVLVAAFGGIGSYGLARTIRQADALSKEQSAPTANREVVALPVTQTPEHILRGETEADEKITLYHEGRLKFVITDRRVLIGSQRPLTSISLDSIAAVRMGWSETINGGLTMIVEYHGERPADAWLIQDFYTGLTSKSTIRAEEERLPRALAKAAGVAFAAPRILPIEGRLPSLKGTAVEVYPKDDLKWPQHCASCMEQLAELSPVFDMVRLEYTTMPSSLLDLKTRIESAPPVILKIPYCRRCQKERLGLLPNRAVRGLHYNGLLIILDFINRGYAQLFVDENSTPQKEG